MDVLTIRPKTVDEKFISRTGCPETPFYPGLLCPMPWSIWRIGGPCFRNMPNAQRSDQMHPNTELQKVTATVSLALFQNIILTKFWMTSPAFVPKELISTGPW